MDDMTVVHTPECLAETKRCKSLQAAFTQQYPNACRFCLGSGMVYADDLAAGIVLHLEPCESCAGSCPRCRTRNDYDENFSEGQANCPVCGFSYALNEHGEPRYQGLPEPYTLQGPCACAIDVWEA